MYRIGVVNAFGVVSTASYGVCGEWEVVIEISHFQTRSANDAIFPAVPGPGVEVTARSFGHAWFRALLGFGL